MKRLDYISWDSYFMGVAILSSKRSKDPSTQVGACIVNEYKRIISLGYNGAPTGFDDDKNMHWEREGNFLDTKYAYVCHSELNAVLNSTASVKNSTLYVTLFPCNECAKEIIQAGISEVIYLSDKYANTNSVIASKRLFDACNVSYHELKDIKNKEVILSLKK